MQNKKRNCKEGTKTVVVMVVVDKFQSGGHKKEQMMVERKMDSARWIPLGCYKFDLTELRDWLRDRAG